MKRDNIELESHIGKWYVIDEIIYLGANYYLLESELYGDEASSIIINDKYEIVLEDVYNGFNDFYEKMGEK